MISESHEERIERLLLVALGISLLVLWNLMKRELKGTGSPRPSFPDLPQLNLMKRELKEAEGAAWVAGPRARIS